jgi:hydroxyethylthiazole kinase-like uncharacterized protein yjeF
MPDVKHGASIPADDYVSLVQPALPATRTWALHDVQSTRTLERAALAATATNTLMQRAGLATARLALAIAPHANRIWVAAGPGNNGGDGVVAATHLHRHGKQVVVSVHGDPGRRPVDAVMAFGQANSAGVDFVSASDIGSTRGFECDLAIDALLGLGASRAPDAALVLAIQALNATRAPVLAVDLPSGLDADSGRLLGIEAVRAAHTLSLLTLKVGLFTAQGRDHAGRVWLDELGVSSSSTLPAAWLFGPDRAAAAFAQRAHAQHKGTFGDVIVIGGAAGLGGAALLAARAALAAGAGRVYLAWLDDRQGGAMDPVRPELMQRPLVEVLRPATLQGATVVCGCGGGRDVRDVLPSVLHHAGRLVLDADALNALAGEPTLASALRARAARDLRTILTPHPLEAARLLDTNAAAVQADRLRAAQSLSDATRACIVLKGSGSVVAAAGEVPVINPTGNARLATPGTGDVLAGWIGGLWSQHQSTTAALTAQASVWLHGRAAENADTRLPLPAADLIEAMRQALATV